MGNIIGWALLVLVIGFCAGAWFTAVIRDRRERRARYPKTPTQRPSGPVSRPPSRPTPPSERLAHPKLPNERPTGPVAPPPSDPAQNLGARQIIITSPRVEIRGSVPVEELRKELLRAESRVRRYGAEDAR